MTLSPGRWLSFCPSRRCSREQEAPRQSRRDVVKILYFAWLRARIEQAEEELALPAEVRDVAGLLDWLRGRGGGYAEALRDLSVIRVAVNQEYVPPSHTVRPRTPMETVYKEVRRRCHAEKRGDSRKRFVCHFRVLF